LRRFLLVLFALLLWSCRASAQLTLTIAFITDGSGISLVGSGTPAASLPFGTVQAFGGTVPTRVTKSVGPSSWTLSTPIDIQVQKGLLDTLSTSFTLTAQLQSADLINTWKWNSVTLSTAPATITTTGAYATVTAHTFSLTVPFSEVAGVIMNTINFTAVAN
jgi:hypothetical protein